jgi:hypothetical protein
MDAGCAPAAATATFLKAWRKISAVLVAGEVVCCGFLVTLAARLLRLRAMLPTGSAAGLG